MASNIILGFSKTGCFCYVVIILSELLTETSGSSLSVYLQTLPVYESNIFVPACGICHVVCVCERALRTDSFARFKRASWISIRDIGLTSIEPNAFRGSKRLRKIEILNNKSLSRLRLKNAMFEGLDHVEGLIIAFCALPSIENRTFADLTSLEFLDLTFNKIYYISKGMFAGLTKLLKLQLQHSQIYTIENDAFIAGSLEAAYSLNWGAREIWGKGGGETFALL